DILHATVGDAPSHAQGGDGAAREVAGLGPGAAGVVHVQGALADVVGDHHWPADLIGNAAAGGGQAAEIHGRRRFALDVGGEAGGRGLDVDDAPVRGSGDHGKARQTCRHLRVVDLEGVGAIHPVHGDIGLIGEIDLLEAGAVHLVGLEAVLSAVGVVHE